MYMYTSPVRCQQIHVHSNAYFPVICGTTFLKSLSMKRSPLPPNQLYSHRQCDYYRLGHLLQTMYHCQQFLLSLILTWHVGLICLNCSSNCLHCHCFVGYNTIQFDILHLNVMHSSRCNPLDLYMETQELHVHIVTSTCRHWHHINTRKYLKHYIWKIMFQS